MFTFVGQEVIQIQKTCNDDQGCAGTDRSNICSLTNKQYDKIEVYDIFERLSHSVVDDNDEEFAVGDLGNNCLDYIQMSDYSLPEYYDFANKRGVTASDIAGFDIETIQALCATRRIDSERLLEYCNMEKSDDAGITYCTERVEVKAALWNFLCTLNNNCSYRSQKGENYAINSRGPFDSSQAGNAQIAIQSGMIDDSDTSLISVIIWENTDEENTIVEITDYDGDVFSSDTLFDDSFIELWIAYEPKTSHAYVIVEHADATMDYGYKLLIHILQQLTSPKVAVNNFDWRMLVEW